MGFKRGLGAPSDSEQNSIYRLAAEEEKKARDRESNGWRQHFLGRKEKGIIYSYLGEVEMCHFS